MEIYLPYEECVQTDAEILTVMVKNRSHSIVDLHADTERFRRVAVIPIDTNFTTSRGLKSKVLTIPYSGQRNSPSRNSLKSNNKPPFTYATMTAITVPLKYLC